MKLPIYKPNVSIDRDRAQLVRLLSRLLEEKLLSKNNNLPDGEVVLSDDENRLLGKLIESVSKDRSFYVALAFVDGLLGSRKLDEGQLREIYLSERKQHGYSRILSSGAWHQFKTRLGGPARDISVYLRAARRMPFDHFIRMEQYLLSMLQVRKEVDAFLIDVIERHRNDIELARETLFERAAPRIVNLEERTRKLLEELQVRRDSLSTNQVAGLTTVIANSTALFSTRDWSAAGTISTMAGGLAFFSGT